MKLYGNDSADPVDTKGRQVAITVSVGSSEIRVGDSQKYKATITDESIRWQTEASEWAIYPNTNEIAESGDDIVIHWEGTCEKVAEKAGRAAPKPGKTYRDCPDCPEMVEIPAGSFDMGSEDDSGADDGPADTSPVHHVTFAKPFAIAKYEVTQRQWRAVMGNNPSYFGECGDDCPVERVSWDDAQQFIKKLNTKTGKHYRLPTEAEWEYACRGGSNDEYCGGDDIDELTGCKGKAGKTCPAGQKQANAFGLYDMTGNVSEWVQDGYHGTYKGAPADGSAWRGANQVFRGGAAGFSPELLRAVARDKAERGWKDRAIGFRLAATLR